MTHTITRAVVAAGGAGTKMAPVTRIIPKEMLPVARTPIFPVPCAVPLTPPGLASSA